MCGAVDIPFFFNTYTHTLNKFSCEICSIFFTTYNNKIGSHKKRCCAPFAFAAGQQVNYLNVSPVCVCVWCVVLYCCTTCVKFVLFIFVCWSLFLLYRIVCVYLLKYMFFSWLKMWFNVCFDLIRLWRAFIVVGWLLFWSSHESFKLMMMHIKR